MQRPRGRQELLCSVLDRQRGVKVAWGPARRQRTNQTGDARQGTGSHSRFMSCPKRLGGLGSRSELTNELQGGKDACQRGSSCDRVAWAERGRQLPKLTPGWSL